MPSDGDCVCDNDMRWMWTVRVHEANRLRAELGVARMAERAAREKYQDFMRTSSMYGVSQSACLCLSAIFFNHRVTTCLENLEMSGNLKHVREMSGMLLTVRELSGKRSCHGKVSQNCSLLDEYMRSYGYLNISISFKNSA